MLTYLYILMYLYHILYLSHKQFLIWEEEEREGDRDTKCVYNLQHFEHLLSVLVYAHQINYKLQFRSTLIFLKLGILHGAKQVSSLS